MNGLEAIGAVTVSAVIVFLNFILFYGIRQHIKKYRQEREIKNRFNKKPTAACYCRDCYHFEPKTGGCYSGHNSQLMNPAWFCYFAAPLTGDSYEERDKQMKKLEEKQNG